MTDITRMIFYSASAFRRGRSSTIRVDTSPTLSAQAAAGTEKYRSRALSVRMCLAIIKALKKRGVDVTIKEVFGT